MSLTRLKIGYDPDTYPPSPNGEVSQKLLADISSAVGAECRSLLHNLDRGFLVINAFKDSIDALREITGVQSVEIDNLFEPDSMHGE